VSASQVLEMVQLASKFGKMAPGFLAMIKAVAKVEDMDLPLLRNQDFIIKCFSEQWGGICCGLDVSVTFRSVCSFFRSSQRYF
jgi:hypothetical protein